MLLTYGLCQISVGLVAGASAMGAYRTCYKCEDNFHRDRTQLPIPGVEPGSVTRDAYLDAVMKSKTWSLVGIVFGGVTVLMGAAITAYAIYNSVLDARASGFCDTKGYKGLTCL